MLDSVLRLFHRESPSHSASDLSHRNTTAELALRVIDSPRVELRQLVNRDAEFRRHVPEHAGKDKGEMLRSGARHLNDAHARTERPR